MNPNYVDLSKQPGTEGREDGQAFWHTFFGGQFSAATILDVGAGLGHSKMRLARGRWGMNRVTTQDIGPDLEVDVTLAIDHIAGNSYDVVTAFDVIEHVDNAIPFLAHMAWIAKEAVVISTPNFNVSRCANKYHAREYTPVQLVALFEEFPFARVRWFSRDTRAPGSIIMEYEKLSEFEKTPDNTLAMLGTL